MDFFSNKSLKPSSSNDDSSTPPHPPLSFSGRRGNDKSKSPMEVKCSAGIGYDTKEFNKETEIEKQLLDKVNQKYSPPTDADDDQLNAAMRKARLVVKVQSEAFMIDDGCQWRKYGKKMANGNPWPRVYYRCTMGSGCPVKKRVQRCAEDQTILITYEGSHNHELSPAAMALAQKAAAALKKAITSMGSALPNNVNDDNNSKVISSNITVIQNFQNIRLGD